jgi:hypothetical protein
VLRALTPSKWTSPEQLVKEGSLNNVQRFYHNSDLVVVVIVSLCAVWFYSSTPMFIRQIVFLTLLCLSHKFNPLLHDASQKGIVSKTPREVC